MYNFHIGRLTPSSAAGFGRISARNLRLSFLFA